MGTLTWNDDLATGNEAIDRYHQRLFQTVDDLLEAAEAGTQRARIGHFIDRLFSGTIDHFAEEEAEMSATDYPEALPHRQAHAVFIGEVATLLQASVAGEHVPMPTVTHLARRLVEHVHHHDQRLATHLRLHAVRA